MLMHQMIRMTKRRLGGDYVLRYKRLHHCIKCNENRIKYLTFHHRDPEAKRFSIGKAVYLGVPLELIMDEVKKCVVICDECHTELHGNRKNKQ